MSSNEYLIITPHTTHDMISIWIGFSFHSQFVASLMETKELMNRHTSKESSSNERKRKHTRKQTYKNETKQNKINANKANQMEK